MQKIRKILRSLEIFKDGLTDQRTDGQGRLLRTPSGTPGVLNKITYLLCTYVELEVEIDSFLNIFATPHKSSMIV